MWFIIFKKQTEKGWRLFTNQIFAEQKDAEEFALKSKKRGQKFEVLEYSIGNLDKYWST
jgi:hypothetical protein